MNLPNEIHQIDNVRKTMPQVHVDKFCRYLKALDINYEKTQIDPNHLKASQGEFNKSKIEAIKKSNTTLAPILISSDLYVIDGHHRWLAQTENDKLDAIKVDLVLNDALKLAREWSYSTFNEETKSIRVY